MKNEEVKKERKDECRVLGRKTPITVAMYLMLLLFLVWSFLFVLVIHSKIIPILPEIMFWVYIASVTLFIGVQFGLALAETLMDAYNSNDSQAGNE